MKAFHPLDCPVLEQIQQEALDYIDTHTMIWNGFWNKIDSQDFLKHNKTVFKYCYSLGYAINEVALLVADKSSTAPRIHIDELPIVAKINFPILNASTATTEWYDVPNLDKLEKRLNVFGEEVVTFETDNYPVIAKSNMDTPIVFNSRIPHAVVTSENTVYPRIVLACMSSNQPLEFLRP